MKKLSVLFLSLFMALSLAACGNSTAGSQVDMPPDQASAAENAPVAEISPESGNGSEEVTPDPAEDEADMTEYDFSIFTNVEITGIDIDALSDEKLSVLYRQARYCQAMTEADTDTMTELVAEDVTFTHMSGRQQTRAEYFADIENESLRYFTIGIENPVIEVDGSFASITYTSVLNANAYGARGTYRMNGTHYFENIDGQWIATNAARDQ